MAVTYNTQAIVLRREDWNGNDSRLTLYTETHGKIEAVARGLRKAKSKLAAHLEPLTTGEIFLVEGRRFPIVAGSSVTDRHLSLTESLSRLATGGLLMRLTDLMTPLESRDNRIYTLLVEALQALEETSDEISTNDAARISHVFAWKILVLSGYHAELRNCLVCLAPIHGDYVAVDVRRGGVVHLACVDQTMHVLNVSFPAVKGLAYTVEAPIRDAFRLRSANGALVEMGHIIEAMVEERFEVGAGSRFWALF